MFQCDSCHKQVGPNVACHHITQQVSFTHPRRPNVGRHWEWDEKRLKWKLVWYDDPGGVGTQTITGMKVVVPHWDKYRISELIEQFIKTVTKIVTHA